MGYISSSELNMELNRSLGNLNEVNVVLSYDKVDTMLRDDKLKVGDTVETNGYYSSNDGGGAKYIITTKTSQPDGYFYLETSNGLVASLIIGNNNTVSFKQIGAKPYDGGTKYDNKRHLEGYLLHLKTLKDRTQRIRLYIPSGIWNFSETTIYDSRGWTIVGDEAFTHRNNSNQGTIINAIADNQNAVWNIGVEDRVQYNFELGNLTFSACEYTKDGVNFRGGRRFNILKRALYFSGSCHGTVHPLSFQEIKGTAFEISTSWEIRFAPMTFRYIGGFTTPVMKFANVLSTLESAMPNISNVHFQLLDFEVVSGDMIQFEERSAFVNSAIGEIVVETSTYAGGTNIEFTSPEYNDATAKKLSIVRIDGELAGNKIGAILLNNFPWLACVDDGQVYSYDTVIGTYADLYNINLNIPLITTQGTRRDYSIIRNFNGSPNSLSTFSIDEVQNKSNSYKGIYNVSKFPTILSKGSYDSKFGGVDLLRGDLIPARDAIVRTSDNNSYTGMLNYDVDSLSPDKLAVRPITWLNRNLGEMLYVANVPGKELKIRMKIPNGQSTSVWVHKKGDQSSYISKTLVGNGSYSDYTLMTKEENVYGLAETLSLNFSVNFETRVDIIAWL